MTKAGHMRIFVFLGLVLSGCGTSGNDLECPMGEGMACASLDKVDTFLDQEDKRLSQGSTDPVEIYVVESNTHETLDWF